MASVNGQTHELARGFRRYETPALVRYGDLAELTAAGMGSKDESAIGQGMSQSRRP